MPIGEGGMGQVYRATDTTLGRQVAIKILPDAFASDPERLARFEREAKTLASLNHPHIAAIYGFEKSSGLHALVMELVEGEDLSQRIARGAIPIDEALPIARQIAEALEAAHEQGIIHRDLKPANIKVRADGTVKVLDFGLAKAIEPAGVSSANAMNSPTLSMHATQAGIILGTAAYMSPEQARGRAVDKRADIWAFGCVLFEMLTGRQLFAGEDLTEILVSVVKEQPDISQSPRHVQKLLRRCLEKDPKKRLRDLGDAWDLLDDPSAATAGAAPAAAYGRSWIAWSVAGVLAIALASLAFLYLRQAPLAAARRTHLFVQLPDNAAPGFFALSPDGRAVVMSYQSKLAIRSLESGALRTLTGTDFARAPFWSPDSDTIAFFSPVDRTLKTLRASGGVAEVLCENVDGTGGGTWNRAGTILFSTRTALMRVSPSGGGCTELIKSDPGVFRAHPVFLPDGDHFLYVQGAAEDARTGVYVGSLRDPVGRRVLADRSSALFVPDTPRSNRGRVLFVREQTLMAQTFDAASFGLSGEPQPVANHVGFTNNTSQIAASVSDDGTLVYLANARVDRQMVWYDRAGVEVGRAPATGVQAAAVSLSPDGKRVLFLRADPQARSTLWVDDLERNQEVRLTNPRLLAGAAVWSPDGQRFAFASNPNAQDRGIFAQSVNGGAEQTILKGNNPVAVSDWSRDGRWIVYTETDAKTGSDIWLLPSGGDATAAKPIPLLRTAANESQGQLSPDGKWLAYTSNDEATPHVYLRAFNGSGPLSDTKWQVSLSSASGRQPRWRADGKELFYLEWPGQAHVKIMSVAMAVGSNPLGTPKPLFEFRSLLTVEGGNVFAYSPSADGQRFLVDAFATDVQPTLEVISNWAGSRP